MFLQVPNLPVATGLTSTSLNRAPGPSNNFVRGKSGYMPFWPGGMDDIQKDSVDIEDLQRGSKEFRTIPPGLTRGLRLPGDDAEADEDLMAEIQVSRPSVGGDIPVCTLRSGSNLWARC